MALTAASMALIALELKRQRTRADGAKLSICALGYPDILCSPDNLLEIFGQEISLASFRSDAEGIREWHGFCGAVSVVDAHEFFAAIGHELTVVDIKVIRGGELVVDLNERLPESFIGKFDLVIDGGTLEHCFNIGQAVANVLKMTKVGGAIHHVHPFNMANHGFYNLNPTWYTDFYGDNGASVQFLKVLTDPRRDGKWIDVPSAGRFSGVPENSLLLSLVRKEADAAIHWPLQQKYR